MAGRTPLLYKNKRYTGKDVQMFFSESMIRFFRLHKEHWFLKEWYKGVATCDILIMNEAKKRIQSMKAIYSGFLRSNLVSWINPTWGPFKKIDSFVGTRAWYDILVHEGYGVHHQPPERKIPAQFKPTAEQLAIVPAWANIKARKNKRGGAGARPFLREALSANVDRFAVIMGDSAVRGIRNNIGGQMGIPRKTLNEFLQQVQAGTV